MKPLFTNVLVRLDTQEDINNHNGLVIPTKSNDITTGTVVSVGAGTPDYPVMVCQPGWRIKFHKNSGERENIEGVEYIVLDEQRKHIIGQL